MTACQQCNFCVYGVACMVFRFFIFLSLDRQRSEKSENSVRLFTFPHQCGDRIFCTFPIFPINYILYYFHLFNLFSASLSRPQTLRQCSSNRSDFSTAVNKINIIHKNLLCVLTSCPVKLPHDYMSP